MVLVFMLLLVDVREEQLCWCLQRGAGVGGEVVIGGGINGLTDDVGVGLGALIVLKSGIAVTGVIEVVGVEVVLFIVIGSGHVHVGGISGSVGADSGDAYMITGGANGVGAHDIISDIGVKGGGESFQ